MPKGTRDMIKQSLDHAIKALVKAEDRLAQVGLIYEADHKDIYDNYCVILASLHTVTKTVEALRTNT